jgi:hypothetical protein
VPKYSLVLERNKIYNRLPERWTRWSDYELATDSVIVFSGKSSVMITSDENGNSFGSVAYSIPATYQGVEI